MGKKQRGGRKGWIRRHLYSIICIAMAAIFATGSIVWYSVTTNEAVEHQQASIEQTKAESEKLVQQAKEKRAR